MSYKFNPFTGSFDNTIGTTVSDFTVTNTLTVETTFTIGTGGTEYTFPSADGTAGYILQTDGAGTLSWVVKPTSAEWTDIGTYLYPTEIGDDVGIGAATKAAATINLNADGTSQFKGVMTMGSGGTAYTLPNADGAAGTVLTTNGAGAVTFVSPSAVINQERHFLHCLMGS